MIFHSLWFTLSAVLVSSFQLCLRVSSQSAFTAVSFRHKNNVSDSVFALLQFCCCCF